MYPRSVYENILYFELLTMLLEGWLDVTILHWFAMKHWSLIIVCPDFKFSYIVDSINDGKTLKNYKLVKIIEEVFEINFKWHMVQCKQQKGS
ncbi:putative papain-like cysteine peptidase superfamily [Helianthus annuus]|nr:putative papain-like cysteine peptidase superfamily [Helianthus annuus]